MRRADRLFDIIQTLRTAARPVTAAALAEGFEVTVRTVYRDIAALQASRVPIEGAAGLGYVLRRGFDLADRDRLLRRRDPGRRVVRAEARLSPLLRRSHPGLAAAGGSVSAG
jgi:arginine repressor